MSYTKLLFWFFICSTLKIHSQVLSCSEIGGVYKSYESFTKHNLDDSICLDIKKNKIITKFYKLIVKEGDHRRSYKNMNLWGYREGNDLYRFFDDHSFFGDFFYIKVLDYNGLILYSKEEADNTKISGAKVNFFYSLDLKSPIKKLNIKNLTNDFSNTQFIEEISNLNELYAKNNNGIFKINILYLKYYAYP